MNYLQKIAMLIGAGSRARAPVGLGMIRRTHLKVEAFDKHGNLKWVDEFDNSASKATFTVSINDTTIGGAFVTTTNAKGGSVDTLYGGGAFTAGDRTLDDDDTLQVTCTLTAAAS